MNQHHNNYCYSNFVVKFINANKTRLILLKKFQHLRENDDADKFAEAMIISTDSMKKFKLPSMKRTTVQSGQLCANAEAIKNIAFLDNNKTPNDVLMELSYNGDNNIRKGAMSFTTCHSVNDNYNLGCNYNISLATTFIGSSDLLLGRIVLFRLKHDIKAYELNLDNDCDRFLSEILYTKLILGDDYELNHLNGKTDNPVHNKDLGFVGCTHCLPQKVIYFFVDLYNETRYQHYYNEFHRLNIVDKTFDVFYQEQNNNFDYPAHDAVFMPDSPTVNDEIYGFRIKGTELRIYNASRHVQIVGVYMNFHIYEDKDKYLNFVGKLFTQCKTKASALVESFKKLLDRMPDEEIIEYLTDNHFDGAGTILHRIKSYKNIYFDILAEQDQDIEKILKNQTNFNNFLNHVYKKRINADDFSQMCTDIKNFCLKGNNNISIWGGSNRKRNNNAPIRGGSYRKRNLIY